MKTSPSANPAFSVTRQLSASSAIPAKAILTKKSMGALSFVEKTTLPRSYVPVYVVFFHGLPVCVVEAKVPDVPARKAIEEARLYADTLNKQFPSKVNPIEVVVGCNGRELAVGPVDTIAADIFSVNDLVVGSAKLQELKKKLGVERLNAIGELHTIRTAAIAQIKPAKILNPQIFLDRMKPNALALGPSTRCSSGRRTRRKSSSYLTKPTSTLPGCGNTTKCFTRCSARSNARSRAITGPSKPTGSTNTPSLVNGGDKLCRMSVSETRDIILDVGVSSVARSR